jgi:AcrR family transcriptional regulator
VTERKPKRRTRERILETALRLFNDFGEPNVTTQLIADDMGISPGNLYYHFHSKDELVEELFSEFEKLFEASIAAPAQRATNVEDIWLFLHTIFEKMWQFRFLYRDLNDLVSRNRLLETHFKRILAHSAKTSETICQGLVASGAMQATRGEIQTLAINVTVIATFWLSFEYVRNPRDPLDDAALLRGAYQVMALTSPYLTDDSRALFDRVSAQYLATT